MKFPHNELHHQSPQQQDRFFRVSLPPGYMQISIEGVVGFILLRGHWIWNEETNIVSIVSLNTCTGNILI